MNTKMNPTVKHASTKSVLKPQDPRKVVDEYFITDRHTQCLNSILSVFFRAGYH